MAAITNIDIVDVELTTGNIFRSFTNKTIGEGDILANRFGVRVLRDGTEVDLTGATCNGYFIRGDGATVVIAGTVSGSTAYVDLPEQCYAYEGQFALAIKVTGEGVTGTLRIVDGVVSNTMTDAAVDPGQIIPSIEELIALIEEAMASIPSDYSELNSYVYGKDIIDHTEILDGKWVDASNGQVKTDSDPSPFCTTPMFPVAMNDVLTCTGGTSGSQGAFYDSNGDYVCGFVNHTDPTIIVPNKANIRYMRWCSLQANKTAMSIKRVKNQSGLLNVNQEIAYLGGARTVLSDLNNAKRNTLYYFMCNAAAQMPDHAPSACPLQFYVLTENSTFVSSNVEYECKEQYIIDYYSFSAIYHRQFMDGAWSSWVPTGNQLYNTVMVNSSGSTRSDVLTNLNNAADNVTYHFLMATTATLPDNYPANVEKLTQFYVKTLTNTLLYQGHYDYHKIQYVIDVPTYAPIAYRTFDDVWSSWVPVGKAEYSKTGLTDDYVLNIEDGTLLQNQFTTGYSVTGYIPVTYGNKVRVGYVQGKDSLIAGCLYDSSKNYIGHFGHDREYMGPGEFLIDDYRAAYIRVNIVSNSMYSRANNYVYVVDSKSCENPKKISVAPNYGTADGCNVFTTLKAASDYIVAYNVWNAEVRVYAGTYDLTVELASVLSSYAGTDRYSYGLQFGHNNHWIFSDGAYIKMLYNGSNVNVANEYSPIVICGSCTIENMDIEVQNCQYCVHDDWYEREKNWIVQYKNCRMKHNGNTVGTYTETACIGGGVLPNELVIIDGGKYTTSSQYDYPISYHSVWANLGSTVPATIIYRHVWVSGGFRFADAPWNCMAVNVFMSDCSYSIAIGGTHTMFTITEWNNVNRSASPSPYVTVVDNLNSQSATDALSANQGRVLNDGKVAKAGDTMTGDLSVEKASGDIVVKAKNKTSTLAAALMVGSGGTNHGVYSWGYVDGNGTFHSSPKWLIYRDVNNKVLVDGKEVPSVVDNLSSTSTTNALSANQGKVLNDGKVDKAGDTMTGNLGVQTSGESIVRIYYGNSGLYTAIDTAFSNHGVWSSGYRDSGGTFHSSGKWIINRDANGKILVNGEDLNTKESFTITFPSGWTSSELTAIKKGGFVYISGFLTKSTATTEKSINLGQIIPSGYRPLNGNSACFAAFDNTTDTPLHGMITADGTLSFYRAEQTSLTKIHFSAVYPV